MVAVWIHKNDSKFGPYMYSNLKDPRYQMIIYMTDQQGEEFVLSSYDLEAAGFELVFGKTYEPSTNLLMKEIPYELAHLRRWAF